MFAPIVWRTIAAPLDNSLAATAKPTYPLGSVDNTLRLLLMVSQKQHVRIAEASQELGVARSTAHRMMQMLQYHGLVAQDADTKAYAVGPALLNLGLQAARDLNLRKLAEPHMAALVSETAETAHLLVRQDANMLCICSVESTLALRVGDRTGMTMPAHATAGGRALLAELPDEQIATIFGSGRLARVTDSTLTSRAQLLEELRLTRERGYAIQRGEYERDISAIGAAVKDSRGAARCALALALPSSRLRDQDVEVLAAATRGCAERIGAELPW